MRRHAITACAFALALCAPAQATTTPAPAVAEPLTSKTEILDKSPAFAGQMSLLGRLPLNSRTEEEPPVVARVDLSDQRMTVYVKGLITHSWKVSTAARGYYTPRGTYKPYRMHTMWRSRKYNNAPMPHAVFFHKGWAIHGTNAIARLGRPASHGCVRLHPDNARTLFNLITQSGGMKAARVIIDN